MLQTLAASSVHKVFRLISALLRTSPSLVRENPGGVPSGSMTRLSSLGGASGASLGLLAFAGLAMSRPRLCFRTLAIRSLSATTASQCSYKTSAAYSSGVLFPDEASSANRV